MQGGRDLVGGLEVLECSKLATWRKVQGVCLLHGATHFRVHVRQCQMLSYAGVLFRVYVESIKNVVAYHVCSELACLIFSSDMSCLSSRFAQQPC